MTNPILVGGNGTTQVFINPRYANRHGLVAGATGTLVSRARRTQKSMSAWH